MDHLSKIPDSVDKNEDFRLYGFFKKGGEYYASEDRRGKNNEVKLSNFVMESLFNLDNGTNNSKRIIKIQRNTGEISIIEVFSSETKLDTFETILKSKRCSFLGTANQLKTIFMRLMDVEAEAIILNVLGWNNEYQVYVFADAVFRNKEILKVNEIGIIEADEKRFYLPAFGLANSNNEDFETEKLYAFQPGETNFAEWSSLFFLSFGTNGAIGIMFLILSVFRDIVFNQVRFFPFLFLFGDFGTGKTSFVERLLSLFGRDIIGTPLNNATSIALSRLASTRINGLFYFKEYTSETDEKAQDFILTAYDGAGRTTGIKSNDNKTKSFPVRSGLIFDGNHLPTQKTAILSRMILLNFEESSFTEDQKKAYDKLKSAASKGLGKVLTEVLGMRELFEKEFKEAFTTNVSELKDKYKNTFPERTLNHIALLMTPAKILWNSLAFPFDFKGVLFSIIENAENQNKLLKQSGAISIFWEAFANNYKKGLIIKFDGMNAKNAHFNIKENKNDETGGIIQIKLQNLFPFYTRYCKENNIQFLDQNSLRMLLTSKSNKDFIHGHQANRGATYTDKNFGSCYQFYYSKTGDSIFIAEIEISL